MGVLNWPIIFVLMLTSALIAVVYKTAQIEQEYKAEFRAECEAKGGVPQFNSHGTDLCHPAGSVIRMETQYGR